MSGRLRDVAELLAVIACAVLVKALASQIDWRFAGPISLLAAVVLASLFLRLRGETWGGYGLAAPAGWRGWAWLPVQSVLAFAVLVAVSLAAQAWIEPVWPRAPQLEDRFAGIEGDAALFALWLAIAILHGGFFEEMIFRGFVITRLRRMIGGGAVIGAWAAGLAVALSAGFFGFRHLATQGTGGALAAFAMGLAYGALFLAFRRNLWPLIIAHAAAGALNMLARFAGPAG